MVSQRGRRQVVQRFMSAREIASAGLRLDLSFLPRSTSGVYKYAKKHGWYNNPKMYRKRSKGIFGVTEYSVDLLPLPLWAALAAEACRAKSPNGHPAIVFRFSLRDRIVFLFKGRF